MNKKISANEFRESLDRHASCLKANPWLAQGIIASEMKGETKVKRKWTTSVVIALLMILTLGTVAYGVTSLCRSVNWQGEVTRTIEAEVTPEPSAEERKEIEAQWSRMQDFIDKLPEDEFVLAWYDTGTEEVDFSDPSKFAYKSMTKHFRNAEDFMEYMSGVTTVTAPVWFPEGQYEYLIADVFLYAGKDGKYELVDEGADGPIHYIRYRVDEKDAVVSGYRLSISMTDRRGYSVSAELRPDGYDDAAYLNDGEIVERVTVKGMDEALLLRNRESGESDLTMRRKLAEPVGLKVVPVRSDEEQIVECSHEVVSCWGFEGVEPDELQKLFNGE